MMRPHARLLLCLGSISMAVVLMCAAERLKAQAEAAKGKTEEAQTAEQKFKNIQVLKGIPADQLIPGMQFVAASLGVECQFCHVEGAFEKDDKKPKQTARKMMEMMFAIDKDNFEGHRQVTCYSCHRGNIHPEAIPAVMAEESRPQVVEAKKAESAEVSAPSPEQLIDKYLQAVGGAAAVEKT